MSQTFVLPIEANAFSLLGVPLSITYTMTTEYLHQFTSTPYTNTFVPEKKKKKTMGKWGWAK